MNKIPNTQLKTLETLSEFKTLDKNKLNLFKKRDINGLKKRKYLLQVPIAKDLFFISARGQRRLESWQGDRPLDPRTRIVLTPNGFSGIINNSSNSIRSNLANLEDNSMAKVIIRCPQCQKIAEVISESEAFGKIFKKYSCGHSVVEKKIVLPDGRDEFWLKLRPYQQAGVEFLEKSGLAALLGDGMGLGKTPQSLMAYRYHTEEMTPTICVVKSALKYQWASHYMEWGVPHNGTFPLDKLPYIITDGKMPILPGFKFYIIGMDLLAKKWQELAALMPQALIVDECHHFKNDGSARTIALTKLVKTANIPHKIFTSGTPILNRATEFFTTLNLIKPDQWPSRQRFYQNWCSTNEKGQYDRINKWRLDEFQTKISPYFLRREKREVLKDLPPFQRNFRWVEIENEELKKSYNRELDKMRNYMLNSGTLDAMTLLGYLTKLRRITGLAKVPVCVEDTMDFLEYADAETGDKIAIGVHHKAVMQALKLSFESKGYNVVTIAGEDNAEAKLAKEQEFKRPENHILLASILAAGEGLNLQYCAMATVLERQWNAAKEEQYEGRFDRFGQTRPTSCDYFIAKGTVDEYFTEEVEKRRKICGDTLGDQFNIEGDLSSLKDLAEKTINNRL